MILQVKTEKELIALVESLKKEVEQLKAQSKPSVETLNENDILGLIKKYVTMDFINKLYKKGK